MYTCYSVAYCGEEFCGANICKPSFTDYEILGITYFSIIPDFKCPTTKEIYKLTQNIRS